MKGAILIFSCEKYRNTRLREFGLSKREYNGWNVFTVFGNPFLSTEFELQDNVITVRCEDSYLYVLKKVAMGMKAILSLFPIEEGILRCGDDLIYNEIALQKFLDGPKDAYMGVTWGRDPRAVELGKHEDNFMWDYYRNHLEDFNNPLHGLPSPNTVRKMNQIPTVVAVSGVIIYFSKKACQAIVDHMESVHWDILQYTEKYGYPYTIEDNSIGFILRKADIYPTNALLYTDREHIFSQSNVIALHTNRYKDSRDDSLAK
jgi:hypothetical protein